jgi:hypothetical protein
LDYSLTPALPKLVIKVFCVVKKKITNGIATIRAPAEKVVNSFFLSETKLNNQSASVCFSTERRTILGKI